VRSSKRQGHRGHPHGMKGQRKRVCRLAHQSSLRNRATGRCNCSRYLATVRRAML
jgi:hypothetical protein